MNWLQPRYSSLTLSGSRSALLGAQTRALCPVHCIPWRPTLVFSHARYRAGAHTVLCREWRQSLSLCPFLAGAGRSSSLPVALPREPTPKLWTWLGWTQDGFHKHVRSQESRGSVPGVR